MIFSAEDKNRSLEIMNLVGENLKKNYRLYNKVNYPFIIIYKGKNCSETYTGEIVYNKMLNSSIVLDNMIVNSCLVQDFQSPLPLSYFLVSNLKWMDNWGGLFSKNRIKNAKFGSLKQIGDTYIIASIKENKESAFFEINDQSYAITRRAANSVKITIKEKSSESRKSRMRSFDNHSAEINFVKNGTKYNPYMIFMDFENNRTMTIQFGNANPYKKLKNKPNGRNLLTIFSMFDEELNPTE